ncbi:MAG: hypothetical protein V2B20_14460 [Pseudomonadota bacterium]
MAYTLKLTGSGEAFTVFERDQVLTADQLNSLREYFDSQDRLTRLCLAGVGIVCGLQVTADLGGVSPSVTVTRGCAITTSGDLLVVEQDRTFRFASQFEDKKAVYPLFFSQGEQIPLYELIEKGPGDSLGILDNIKNCVCLLYLERYDDDPDICTGGSCDNKGILRNEKLRFLLIDAKQGQGLKGSTIDLPACYRRLVNLDRSRPLLSTISIDSYDKLAECYSLQLIPCLEKVIAALRNLYPVCVSFLGAAYPADPMKVWSETLVEVRKWVEDKTPIGVQCAYRFLGDIIAAYNEFKESLFTDRGTCSPDRETFPAHVLLGALSPTTIDRDSLRHGFYPSPTGKCGSDSIERALFLFRRLDTMICSLSLPLKETTIKVIPDRTPGSLLGLRTIPFYYGKASQLNRYWNFDFSLRGKEDYIYSYYSTKIPDPLKLSLDGYPCLRIEGHVGNDYQVAETALNKIIADNDLPLKVVSFQIEDQAHIMPWKPPKGPATLEFLHGLLRFDIHRQLVDLEDFTGLLDETIQKSSDLPTKEAAETSLSIKDFSTEKAAVLGGKLANLKVQIRKPMQEFEHERFEKDFEEVVAAVSAYNKGVRGVISQTSFTPYEKLINDTQFHWLRRTDDVLKNIKDKMLRFTVFDRFLTENPGVEHNGTVERGGTFILVYSSLTKKVVADFSLPYRSTEGSQDIELGDFWPDLEVMPGWRGRNELAVRPGKETVIQGQLATLMEDLRKAKNRLDDFDIRLVTQQDSLKNCTGTISSIMDRINPPKAGELFTDPDLAHASSLLDTMKSYVAGIEGKIDRNEATAADLAMRESVDTMMTTVISGTMSKISSGKSDIVNGSEQDRFLAKASADSTVIRNSSAKEGLAKAAASIGASAAGKPLLNERLNGFNRLER